MFGPEHFWEKIEEVLDEWMTLHDIAFEARLSCGSVQYGLTWGIERGLATLGWQQHRGKKTAFYRRQRTSLVAGGGAVV